MKKIFLLLILFSVVVVAEPLEYKIDFYDVGDMTDSVYLYNREIHFVGTQGSMSTLNIDDRTITLTNGENKTVDGLNIHIKSSSDNANIVMPDNKIVKGEAATVIFKQVTNKEFENGEIFVPIDQYEYYLDREIKISNLGISEEGVPGAIFKHKGIEKTVFEGDKIFLNYLDIGVEDVVLGKGVVSSQKIQGAKLKINNGVDLKNYPLLFSEDDLIIVIDNKAPMYHSDLAEQVLMSIPQYENRQTEIKIGRDLSGYEWDNENLILIGGSCLMNIEGKCAGENFPGSGQIRLIYENDRVILSLEGYGENELREAIRILKEEKISGLINPFETDPSEYLDGQQPTENSLGDRVEIKKLQDLNSTIIDVKEEIQTEEKPIKNSKEILVVRPERKSVWKRMVDFLFGWL